MNDKLRIALNLALEDEDKTSIGMQSEKLTHRVLKYYIEENKDRHEVRLRHCNYIVDIYKDGVCFEIQTKNFRVIKEKIETILHNGEKLQVVYPVINNKEIHWLNSQNQLDSKSKSTKKMTSSWLLIELYSLPIKLLKHENLTFRIIEINEVEFKYNDGYGPNKRNRATKINRVPAYINNEVIIEKLIDYIQLIPKELMEIEFTSKVFAKYTKQKLKDARISLLVLYRLGLLERFRGRTNEYIYKLTKTPI